MFFEKHYIRPVRVRMSAFFCEKAEKIRNSEIFEKISKTP